jgi:alanine racemase
MIYRNHKRFAKYDFNYKALQHNFQLIKNSIDKGCQIYPVVKANAYGCGAIQCTRELNKYADGFCVSTIGEAIEIKNIVGNKPILIFTGFGNLEELEICKANNFMPVVFNLQQLDLLKKYNYKVKIFIKFNTGMGRIGFEYENIEIIKNFSKQIVGIMSHFCCADEEDTNITISQINKFKKITQHFSCDIKKTIANSAGVFNHPSSHFDMVRPGIAIYGISPFNISGQPQLRPVIRFSTKIIAIYQRKKGQKVGYGGIYTCDKNTRIGVVAAGYADGYPRVLNKKTYVWINGKSAPLIGRVSMDSLCIKLDDLQANIGDEVELWGENIKIEDVASSANTIGYELATRAYAI